MRKLSVCLFYGLCVFTIVFSLFWMALPKLPLSQTPAGSETDPASPLSLAAQAVPQTDAARYCLRTGGGVHLPRRRHPGHFDPRDRYLHQSSAGK